MEIAGSLRPISRTISWRRSRGLADAAVLVARRGGKQEIVTKSARETRLEFMLTL
jgi:hypothetical protein